MEFSQISQTRSSQSSNWGTEACSSHKDILTQAMWLQFEKSNNKGAIIGWTAATAFAIFFSEWLIHLPLFNVVGLAWLCIGPLCCVCSLQSEPDPCSNTCLCSYWVSPSSSLDCCCSHTWVSSTWTRAMTTVQTSRTWR